MKSFSWKITLCLVPILLAAYIVGNAFWEYYEGKGGFKLGVDLVGGTILIYEVDLDKIEGDDHVRGKLPSSWDPQKLADQLKKRIDPNDLYNVTIRVAGKTRFEIILPTGGFHQIRSEEEAWKKLLEKVEEKYPYKNYTVAPGQVVELLAAIDAQLDPEKGAPVDQIRSFIASHYTEPKLLGSKRLASAAGLRDKAWQSLLDDAKKEYPPKGYHVGRGRTDELTRLILAQYPNLNTTEKAEVSDLVKQGVATGKSLTTEKIEECKALLRQVGNLEFRIIATSDHDGPAFEAASTFFTRPRTGEKLKAFQESLNNAAFLGLPPPAPDSISDEKLFTARGVNGADLGKFTYSWVELDPGFRREHGLANPRDKNNRLIDNPDRKAATGYMTGDGSLPSRNWYQAKEARDKGVPFVLTDRASTVGLVYSREVQNPRTRDKDPEKRYEYYVLSRDAEDPSKRVTGAELSGAAPSMRDSKLSIEFTMNPKGALLFQDFTSKNVGQPMAIVMDGRVESIAVINGPISSNGQITGNFTRDRVDQTVKVLRSGALPATLKPDPVSESTMGPTLGGDTIKWGAISVILAFMAVLLFMLVYYRFAGFVACVALLANLLLTVAFMVTISATFTLPGLAGLVLMLGMAVDANVLIYERLREERERGANLLLALRNGYDHAMPTIIDTHLSSIFTAIVLWVVGNDQLKGFGISLTVGLIISLYTSLYMTWVIFEVWRTRNWLHDLQMMELFKRPNIPFMKIRYYWFGATLALTILGGALFIYRLDSGPNNPSVLNIDFMGGTAYSFELKDFKSIDEIRKVLDESPLQDKSVDQIWVSDENYTKGDKSKLFTFRTSEKNVDRVRAEINRLLGTGGNNWLKITELSGFLVELKEPKKPSEVKAALDTGLLKGLPIEAIYTDPKSESKDEPSKLFHVNPGENLTAPIQAELTKVLGAGGKDWLARSEFLGFEIDPTGKEVTFEFADPDKKVPFASRAQVTIALNKGFLAQAEKLRKLAGNFASLATTLKANDLEAIGEPKGSTWATESARKDVAEMLADLADEAKVPAFKVSAADLESADKRDALAKLLTEKLNLEDQRKLQLRLQDSATRLETAAQQFVLQGLGRESEGRFRWMKLSLVQPLEGANRAYLVNILESTRKQFEAPVPERLENFDSQLATETQFRALYAILASWGAVLLYRWFRFGSWTFGLAAVLCLIHDLFFTLGIIAACTYLTNIPFLNQFLGIRDFKIDLPAVAALLTLVGYSVNDTIVVFDRIREVRGKNPSLTAKMIDDSVNQTLSRTVLASLATWLVVLVLYIAGGEGVHLFAFVMVVGVIVGTYSSIYIASPLLLMFGEGGKTPVGANRVNTAVTVPT